MAGGDYLKFSFVEGKNRHVSTTINATGASVALVAPSSDHYTLHIQKIVIAVTTYATKTWTFRTLDATGTPIGVLFIPAAGPTGGNQGSLEYSLDFGPQGFKLELPGAPLFLDVSATGAAAAIVVDCYEHITGPVSIEQSSAT